MHICEFYVLYAHPHTSDGACEYWLCSQLYISPPQLCHTLNGTVGMLSSAGGSCRAALGSINFIAYFYNPPLCMHPPSHPIASALTVHTAVKFRVSPCFMVACSSSHSRFLYLLLLLFDILLYICVYLVSFLLWLIELSAFSRCDHGKSLQWVFITLPSSLLLCISSCSKCRLHTDNMWTCIPMWAVPTTAYA